MSNAWSFEMPLSDVNPAQHSSLCTLACCHYHWRTLQEDADLQPKSCNSAT